MALSDEFSRSVSALKFGTTFKTTSQDRMPESTALLIARLQGREHTIVDLAASDGNTTADLAVALGDRFRRLVAADLNDSVDVAGRDDTLLLCDSDSAIMIVTSRLVWYRDTSGADPLSRVLVQRKFARSEAETEPRTPVRLVNPRYLEMMMRDPRLEFRRHDMFEPLPFEATVIRIANILNSGYFSQAAIADAVRTSADRLIEGGLLLVTRNHRSVEKASLFKRRASRLELVDQLGVGNEVASIVASVELR